MICLLSHAMTVYLMTKVSLLFNLITLTYELLEILFTKSFDLEVYIIHFTHLDNKRDVGLRYQIESVCDTYIGILTIVIHFTDKIDVSALCTYTKVHKHTMCIHITAANY